MDDVSSLACPTMAGTASVAIARDASRSIVRWAIVGAASVLLFLLALAHSAAVGAQVPYPTVGGATLLPPGTTTTTMPATSSTGYPPNALITAPYFDNRYGFVEVVTDGSGNLIDINPTTGQRIFPIFADFVPTFVNGNFINGFNGNFVNPTFVNPNLVNGTFLPPGITNGITCNGVFGCPFGGGFIGNANVNFVNGNICTFANCTNVFPAGGTVIGGAVFYNDNRFCTDGKLVFVPNRGYFCQNGGPLVPNNTTTTVNCANFVFNGCGIFRTFEVTQPTTAPAAAPVAAPVAAPTAPVAAPAAVQQAPVVAPQAQMPTALTAPQVQTPDATIGGSNVHVLSASPATAPAATGVGGSDDHR